MSQPTAGDLVSRSRKYVLATKRGQPTDEHREALATADEDALAALDEDAALAFWVNVYKAAVQEDLQRDPDIFADTSGLFGGRVLTVAGHNLSLDDVEHGILRGSKTKYGLGSLPRRLSTTSTLLAFAWQDDHGPDAVYSG